MDSGNFVVLLRAPVRSTSSPPPFSFPRHLNIGGIVGFGGGGGIVVEAAAVLHPFFLYISLALFLPWSIVRHPMRFLCFLSWLLIGRKSASSCKGVLLMGKK